MPLPAHAEKNAVLRMGRHLPVRLFDITLGQERAAAKSQDTCRNLIDRDIREGAIFATNRIIDAGTFQKRQVHNQPAQTLF